MPSERYYSTDEYINVLPYAITDTCQRFSLSRLNPSKDAVAWGFHMLMFWNSSYNATENCGAFESIKMYLCQGGAGHSAVAAHGVGVGGGRGEGMKTGEGVTDWEILASFKDGIPVVGALQGVDIRGHLFPWNTIVVVICFTGDSIRRVDSEIRNMCWYVRPLPEQLVLSSQHNRFLSLSVISIVRL